MKSYVIWLLLSGSPLPQHHHIHSHSCHSAIACKCEEHCRSLLLSPCLVLSVFLCCVSHTFTVYILSWNLHFNLLFLYFLSPHIPSSLSLFYDRVSYNSACRCICHGIKDDGLPTHKALKLNSFYKSKENSKQDFTP